VTKSRDEHRHRIDESTFVIATNGFAEGPAQALRDYLVARNAGRVTVVNHPLVAEGGNNHVVTTYSGAETKTREYRLPNKPPYTYLLDPLIPLRLPASTAWFGFNNLAALRGLSRRRFGKTKKVYYWAVDFVPQRFGRGPATAAYSRVDQLVCSRVDARIELTAQALRGRTSALNLNVHAMAPAIVVPMGAWLGRTPKVTTSSWSEQRLVYLGHLVERQGVATLIESLPLLLEKHPLVRVDVIGSGPLESRLRDLARALDVNGHVEFHGFVTDHKDVERILARATIAVAPYVKDSESFTRFADPGKLKVYLAAGLPIVLTDVPPNAKELETAGAAILSDDKPEALAWAVERLLADENLWLAAHVAALEYAQQFDWNTVLGEGLAKLGFVAGGEDR
jgi:glycosyltransferase involved in cell wall biosynthesis